MYIKFLKNKYAKALIVLDGYNNGPNPKDSAHQRGNIGPKVYISENMTMQINKQVFLYNGKK
jgi:hypothetical protein